MSENLAKMISRHLIFIFLILTDLAHADLNVWVTGESEKIQPHDKRQNKNYIYDAASNSINIKGAKNEVIAFQIVLCSKDYMEKINVKVGNLISGIDKISQNNFELFREWYIKSPASSAFSNEKAGEFPDALIPFKDPYGSHQNVGAPFKLHKYRNEVIWIDLHIPEDAPTGNYKGVVQIFVDEKLTTTLNINLTVWDFQIPKESSLNAWIPLYGNRLAKGEGFNDWDFPDEPSWKIVREYFRMAREHRFMTQLGDGYDGIEIDWDESSGKLRNINWNKHDRYFGEVLNGQLFKDGLPPHVWKVGGFVWWGARPGSTSTSPPIRLSSS